MEPLISIKDILAVWHAFSHEDSTEGWRSIRIGTADKIAIIAGCRFPEKEEYIAFGFSEFQFPVGYRYPQCKGFHVLQNDKIVGSGNSCWLVILKHKHVGLDMFGTMIEDLLKTMQRISSSNELYIFKSIVSRIRLWQRFMSKSALPVLSQEKELGLLGELTFLKKLLSTLEKEEALESWKGPLDEPKDFILGNGGVEVKSTAATKQFKAKISSLEQLDTSSVDPLFVIGYRFESNGPDGSLVSMINRIRDILIDDREILEKFEYLLLHYGYIDIYASEYTCIYSLKEKLVFRVIDGFPRITEENAMSGILDAKYEIDLSNLPQENLDYEEILKLLGVLL